MRSFDELLTEAAGADVTGWGFDWLNGRATEERPTWGYANLLADRVGHAQSALDIDTGGGEVLAEAPVLPPQEGYYFAQHVGPAPAFELIEHFLGPLTTERRARDPQRESAAAQAAGLVISDLRTARCRMEFYDVGAVVWVL